MEQLLEKVRQWGHDRNLNAPENLKGQTFKLVSEFGEIAEGLINKDNGETIDGIGDTLVVAIIIGEQIGRRITIVDTDGAGAQKINCDFVGPLAALGRLADGVLKGQPEVQRQELGEFVQRMCDMTKWFGYWPQDCLQKAYDEIKDRKGVMFNGAFIKEADGQLYTDALKALGRI